MGILDKLPFKRHHDSPPDFSEIPTDTSEPSQDFQQYPQPFDQQDPFGQSAMDDQTGMPTTPGTHGDYMNVSHEPSGGDRARAFAQSLQSPGVHPSRMQPSGMQSASAATLSGNSELSLVLERLDTIKAELDAIKQRMYRLDQYLDSQSKRKYW